MTKEAAIELFRENMGDMGQVGPVSLFLENSISMTDPAIDGHDIDAANNYERVQTAQNRFRAQEIHDGVLSGSMDGVRGGIAARVADNRDSKEAKAAKEQRQADDTMFYLALMQNGDFIRFAAERAFDNMSDQEILDFIGDVEAATGKTFEENIIEVLGPDYAKREGESAVDYAKRVGPEAAAQMTELDPETGRIVAKPGYEDHPLAPLMIEVAEKELSNPQVQNAITMLQNGHTGAEVVATLHAAGATDQGASTETLREGLREQFAASADPEQATVLTALDADRDVGTDDGLDVDERVENTSNFLGGLALT